MILGRHNLIRQCSVGLRASRGRKSIEAHILGKKKKKKNKEGKEAKMTNSTTPMMMGNGGHAFQLKNSLLSLMHSFIILNDVMFIKYISMSSGTVVGFVRF